jgi:hypothetical protein
MSDLQKFCDRNEFAFKSRRLTYTFSIRNNIKQTTMPEVNRFEIHGKQGVVRFDVILEDAKVNKNPIKRVSTFGETTLEDIYSKLQVRIGRKLFIKSLNYLLGSRRTKEKVRVSTTILIGRTKKEGSRSSGKAEKATNFWRRHTVQGN